MVFIFLTFILSLIFFIIDFKRKFKNPKDLVFKESIVGEFLDIDLDFIMSLRGYLKEKDFIFMDSFINRDDNGYTTNTEYFCSNNKPIIAQISQVKGKNFSKFVLNYTTYFLDGTRLTSSTNPELNPNILSEKFIVKYYPHLNPSEIFEHHVKDVEKMSKTRNISYDVVNINYRQLAEKEYKELLETNEKKGLMKLNEKLNCYQYTLYGAIRITINRSVVEKDQIIVTQAMIHLLKSFDRNTY
jgi:hypothetical protein